MDETDLDEVSFWVKLFLDGVAFFWADEAVLDEIVHPNWMKCTSCEHHRQGVWESFRRHPDDSKGKSAR